MKPGPIDEAQVLQAAALIGLEIPRERVAGVVATLGNIAKVAQAVNEVELSAADELAPVWKP